jgi:hypothetical protein
MSEDLESRINKVITTCKEGRKKYNSGMFIDILSDFIEITKKDLKTEQYVKLNEYIQRERSKYK